MEKEKQEILLNEFDYLVGQINGSQTDAIVKKELRKLFIDLLKTNYRNYLIKCKVNNMKDLQIATILLVITVLVFCGAIIHSLFIS